MLEGPKKRLCVVQPPDELVTVLGAGVFSIFSAVNIYRDNSLGLSQQRLVGLSGIDFMLTFLPTCFLNLKCKPQSGLLRILFLGASWFFFNLLAASGSVLLWQTLIDRDKAISWPAKLDLAKKEIFNSIRALELIMLAGCVLVAVMAVFGIGVSCYSRIIRCSNSFFSRSGVQGGELVPPQRLPTIDEEEDGVDTDSAYSRAPGHER